MSRRAVVLLSGGLDSATCLGIAREGGYEVAALAFDYGQRHRVELGFAQEQARLQGAAEFTVARIDPGAFHGASALTGGGAVPKTGDVGGDIPVTYVPARNAVFLSYALAKAEAWGASAIYIGVNALDYSGYPDCRPEFVAAFEAMANLATKAGVEALSRGERWLTVEAPLQHLTKAGIVREALRLGVDVGRTSSCYDPGSGGEACGLCEACVLRARGFAEAGATDPAAAR